MLSHFYVGAVFLVGAMMCYLGIQSPWVNPRNREIMIDLAVACIIGFFLFLLVYIGNPSITIYMNKFPRY